MPPEIPDTRSVVVRPDETERARATLLVIDGASSRIVGFPAAGVLVAGRGAEADIRLADESVSRRHVEIGVSGDDVTVADLGSHNGTKLNGEWLRGRAPLRQSDVVVLGESALVLSAVTRRTGEPRAAASIDPGAMRVRLADEIERALEYDRPVSVVVVAFGDGEPAREPSALASGLRAIDFASADGARRVLVVMPEFDGETAAAVAADVLAAHAPSGRAGVATFADDGVTPDVLVAAARSAVRAAEPGAVSSADASVRRLTLPDGDVLVADPAMERVHDLASRLAASDLPVLVLGETGTGKEHVAHAIHIGSARAAGPFVAVNCASIAETLAESELFGHERGAFSGALTAKSGLFEAAKGGTIFLDEVGELSASTQARLLRVLETKRIMRVGSTRESAVDVRVVAATHRRIDDLTEAGQFRKDLLFRLAAARIEIPPLRERPRDIVVLARTFLSAARTRLRRPAMAIGPGAMHVLATHGWPGNVRELRNAIDFAAVTSAEEARLERWHLPPLAGSSAAAESGAASGAPPPGSTEAPARGGRTFRPVADEVRDLEKERMREALDAAAGNQTRAAAMIGMPLRTFVTKLKAYGLRS